MASWCSKGFANVAPRVKKIKSRVLVGMNSEFSRIYGGEKVTPNKYPFIVRINKWVGNQDRY